jgi:hypothetical protein
MSNYLDLLKQLQGEEETEKTVVPFAAPQATMPDDLAQAAEDEAMELSPAPARQPAFSAPVAPAAPKMEDLSKHLLQTEAPAPVDLRSPATENSNETMTKTKTSISGTAPVDAPKGPSSPEERLEQLMKDLDIQRKKEREEAASRQFKAELAQAITKGMGGIIAGNQAMNTKAVVNPIKTGTVDVGDLVGQVDKRFAGDREALLDQYKQLLGAKDKAAQRKFQEEQLKVMREGNKNKYDIAKLKADAKGEGLTPGQEAQDKDFGKYNNEWTTTGRSKFDSNLKKLEDVAAELEKLPASTKNSDDRLIGRLPDVFQSEADINRREMVRAAAQESLRATLGSQFTEKEGVSIMNRAYDPTLSPASNLKRINGIIAELKQSRDANDHRSKEFESKGTLSKLQTSPKSQNTISNVEAPAGKIAVSDGKTTMFIDPSDEAEAATDGFKRIK